MAVHINSVTLMPDSEMIASTSSGTLMAIDLVVVFFLPAPSLFPPLFFVVSHIIYNFATKTQGGEGFPSPLELVLFLFRNHLDVNLGVNLNLPNLE